MFCKLWEEGSSAADCVADVTDVTDIRKFGSGLCSGCNGYQEGGRRKRGWFWRSISNIATALMVRTFLIAETIVFYCQRPIDIVSGCIGMIGEDTAVPCPYPH
ncbi:hypothetical protein QT972_11155 [Microcoleus sp. herbarium7]|uniref:hypothetical protein n=1 Tax=Microcoleus sp. herbarium7 TaxID=3055435 RepID=UPI002FCF393D